jgi:hypothetical protein
LSFNLDAVSDGERITRYINQTKKMRPGIGRPKYTAFMPPENRRVSVCRSQDLTETEIWQIADQFVGPTVARADISAAQIIADFSSENIQAEPLLIEPVPHPYPRHADIVNWPVDVDIQRAIAVELANRANLVKR